MGYEYTLQEALDRLTILPNLFPSFRDQKPTERDTLLTGTDQNLSGFTHTPTG
jgi:hypothetical protein